MRAIIFDTESTGSHYEEICQLSYIIREGTELTGKNFYFTVPTMSKHALAIHGLSLFKLHELSEGRTFCDSIDEIDEDFSNSDLLIGHNVASDVRRMRKEFARCDRKLQQIETFCTMRYFTNAMQLTNPDGSRKFPNLAELCSYYRVEDERVRDICQQAFNVQDISSHDARYDTAATYVAVLNAIKQGDLKEVF